MTELEKIEYAKSFIDRVTRLTNLVLRRSLRVIAAQRAQNEQMRAAFAKLGVVKFK